MGELEVAAHLVLLAVSALTTAGLAVYGWRRRREPGAGAYAALMVAFTAFTGFHGAGLFVHGPALRRGMEVLQWTGVCAVPVCWAVFALAYTGHDRFLTARTVAGLSVVPAVTLGLVATNPAHGLVFAGTTLREVAGVVLLDQTFGPWFWGFLGYTYLLLALGSGLLLRLILTSDYLFRDQSVLLIVGVAVPWLANALTVAGVTPTEPALDMTPYAFTVTGLAFGYATFRGHLLDLVPATRQLGRGVAVRNLDDGVLIVDTARRLVYCNAAAADILDCDRSDVVGDPVAGVLDPDALEFGAPDALATFERGDRTYEARTSPVESRDGRVIGHTVVLNDVTDREERERRLRNRRDELRRLEALNGAVRGVNRALVEAATVDDVETAVAEQLADSALYDGVRVSLTPPRGVGDDVGPRVLDDGDDAAWPVDPALDDDTGTDTRTAGTSDPRPADGGTEATPQGSWAVAPAVYGRTSYGVLAVRSVRGSEVSERELAVLGELGELVGHAVNALRSRRLLTADDRVELEFVCDDSDRLATLAAAAGVALDLEAVTPLAGADLLVDVRVGSDDAGGNQSPTERLVAAADGDDAVIEARAVGGASGDRVELTMTGGSLLFPLVELGGRVRSLSADTDQVRAVAEFPPGVDVRATVERVEATVPGARLVARREREHEPALDDADGPDVTDRQREALEVAYGAGYFEWPRDATAEDVAEAMDITSPTLQQHLRTAHRKLVGTYVDEDREGERDSGGE